MTAHRSDQDVLDGHLSTSLHGSVEEDLERNYAPDVVIVSNWGVKHGHDDLRQMTRLLQSQLPECTFTYGARLIEGGIGLLDWTGHSPAGSVRDGVDSYVISDGLIRAQTIHDPLTPVGRVVAGTLTLIGSGELTAAMRPLDTLLLAQTTGRRLLAVPTAAGAEGPATADVVVAAAAEHFNRLGASLEVAAVWTREDAVDPAMLSPVCEADLLYLSGGQVGYLAEPLVGSPFADALVSAWRAGRPMAAASAGAVALGPAVYDPEDQQAPARAGLAVVDGRHSALSGGQVAGIVR